MLIVLVLGSRRGCCLGSRLKTITKTITKSCDVSRIIDADNKGNLLLFDAGAHDVDKKCGANYVRARQFRGFNAILTAFSVGIHR
jgi:hypothetical protein